MISGIDILKFFLAFLVVAIHTHFNGCNEWLLTLTTLAVPLFFTISGYLIQLRTEDMSREESQNYLFKYLKRSCRLYIIWSILYLPLTLLGFIKGEESFAIRVFSLIRGWFLVGENYMSWPLWYLLALIVAVFLIKIFKKAALPLEIIFLISLSLHFVGYGLDYAHLHELGSDSFQQGIGIYFLLFKSTRNGIFLGMCFVCTGMMVKKYEEVIWTNARWILLPLCVIAFWLCHEGIMFSDLIFSAALLTIVLHTKTRHGTFSVMLRKMSTLIYFSHMFFVAYIQLSHPDCPTLWQFLMVSGLCIVISYLFIKVAAIEKFSFLRVLLT